MMVIIPCISALSMLLCSEYFFSFFMKEKLLNQSFSYVFHSFTIGLNVFPIFKSLLCFVFFSWNFCKFCWCMILQRNIYKHNFELMLLNFIPNLTPIFYLINEMKKWEIFNILFLLVVIYFKTGHWHNV